MSVVQLVKDACGKLAGFGARGERAYARFLAAVRDLEAGEMLSFEYKVPRSGPFHRRHFKMLWAFFAAQEQFVDEHDFRKWTEVGAGHVQFVPGPDGRMVALPKSISYEALDDEPFRELHEKVVRFLRSQHATRFLWPHLSDLQAGNMVETILAEFER